MNFKSEEETIIGFMAEELISELDGKEGATFKWFPNGEYSKSGDYGILSEGEIYQKEVKADNYKSSIRFPLEFEHKVNGLWIPSGYKTSSSAAIEAYRLNKDTCYRIERHTLLQFLNKGHINKSLVMICNRYKPVPTKCYMLNYDDFNKLGLFSNIRSNVTDNFTNNELYSIFKNTKGVTINLPLEKIKIIKDLIS
jgi:hypothetical protein